jgi:hypothetical protein
MKVGRDTVPLAKPKHLGDLRRIDELISTGIGRFHTGSLQM